jgi:hypothetical protein
MIGGRDWDMERKRFQPGFREKKENLPHELRTRFDVIGQRRPERPGAIRQETGGDFNEDI